MKNNNTTNALSEALSTKTKKVITPEQGKQHIKTEAGYLYELDIDKDKIKSTKKTGDDLEITLGTYILNPITASEQCF